MFIAWIKKEKELSVFKRFVLPILSIVACLFMVFATIYAHGVIPYQNAVKNGTGFVFPVLFYLIVFVAIMIAGYFFSNSFKAILAKKSSGNEIKSEKEDA
jgi:APA family basic amino acid/polyamine antiporter